MNLSLRQKVYVALAGAIFLLHISIAFFAKPSFALTMVGDVISVRYASYRHLVICK